MKWKLFIFGNCGRLFSEGWIGGAPATTDNLNLDNDHGCCGGREQVQSRLAFIIGRGADLCYNGSFNRAQHG